MALRSLRVRDFRCLAQFEIPALEDEAWIIGENAAGKTALLEAVYCLSRGASFRGRRYGPLVRWGQPCSKVEGAVGFDALTEPVSLVLGANGRWQLYPKSDRPPFVVRLVCETSHALVEGEPAWRRRFLDWNLSLWEGGSLGVFSRFRRVAAQRNAWLRAGGRGAAIWDHEYAVVLSKINGLRWALWREIRERFGELLRLFPRFRALRMEAGLGETEAARVKEGLVEMRDRDVERGYTQIGASRGDYWLEVGGKRWIGSRGESKVLGILMQLAAEQAVVERTERPALWLVDDLNAELSPKVATELVGVFRDLTGQRIFTALAGAGLLQSVSTTPEQMFHVEPV